MDASGRHWKFRAPTRGIPNDSIWPDNPTDCSPDQTTPWGTVALIKAFLVIQKPIAPPGAYYLETENILQSVENVDL